MEIIHSSDLLDITNNQIASILEKNKEEILSNPNPPLIILSTGAYCPPHKVHLQNFQVCKNQIKNYNIILGLISPSHDIYVKNKNNFPWDLSCITRLELLDSIIKEEKKENFIIVDSWEGCQSDFIYFPSVFKLRGEEIQNLSKQILGKEIKFAFLMGADLVIRSNCLECMTKTGIVIIVNRPNFNNQIVQDMKNNLEKKYQDNVIILEPQQNDFYDAMSSTHIRDLYSKGKYDDVKKFTSNNCIDILNNYFDMIKS